MTMKCRSVALLISVATAVAAPDIAAAQPAAPEASASADAAKRADALVQKAGRLYSDGQYQDAEALLLMAWELNPTFDVAYNLGNTEYKLKKYKEAAQYLSFALRHWPLLKGVAKLRPRAEQWLAESRAQVGALKVSVTVAGAEVLVDGKNVGRAPLEGEVFVDPGEHRVEAMHLDYEPSSQTVSVAKGGTAEVKLAITPVRSEAQASAGVKTEGSGSATGAGVVGPVAGPPAGSVEPPPPPPPEKRNWVPVIALGGASAVGLAVGVTTTVLSRNARESADAHQGQIRQMNGRCIEPPSHLTQKCRELERETVRADSLGTVSVISYAASGALAIAAVTYALWPRRAASAGHGLRVLPQMHARGGGVFVVGAW
ncbi:PEGA domain-containing protein [Sorangium sp. So ce1097]|uniref:PEGA domain-containing protein n=1 Tax=Sorangium sp. So ce1097 TaxID=3133330 RepID=UPI003F617584